MFRQFDGRMKETRSDQGFDPMPVTDMKEAVPIKRIGHRFMDRGRALS